MSLSAAMAEWKLDLNTYGLQIEEEKKQHGPIFSAIRDVVTSVMFQTCMTVLVFLYLLATSLGMILGKPLSHG
ncbi:hypothetical protein DSO57_1004299 [Entomophthora muscae]|uniref:Uncharacterized protein n=1 Tax=Entomophthora muscae TaxID=34485 RepID=A0ACC2TVU5_9FUNG|nr:hypothetical protein DSO57_1004299 [Entomophthora muscae]